MSQRSLLFEAERIALSRAGSGQDRAIEASDFPFEALSDIAELESWRKEVHRPIYHIHKWWAQRLGSIFRAIVLGAVAPARSDVLRLFHSPTALPDIVVFDPFMGSGTTIGETLKLGGRAIGFDINPVAHFLVQNALDLPKRHDLLETFRAIEHDVAAKIQTYYQASLPGGAPAQALYYFWVKQAPCPRCRENVDLFSSYIFADHAYRNRYPDARVLCPRCGAVNTTRHGSVSVTCGTCGHSFDPRSGPAHGTKATCPRCSECFGIARAVREQGTPPSHRLYAKLVLTENGEKAYVAADNDDRRLYERAETALAARRTPYPVVRIQPGYNTNQVLNYCYTYWHQMFNARQLLCLSILADRIREIPDERMREAFCCLFSGVLEFNNMFTSFKGEGTGAVRHMFSHHILKPERAPLEANVWGTPKSSGAFSTLFRSRILRALDYSEDPFELRVSYRSGRMQSAKVRGLSEALGHHAVSSFAEFSGAQARLYLACRDSARTDLAAESVDVVITDPPFFDNVHYSQLADFFHVWQRHILGATGSHDPETTRSDAEVQQSDPALFTQRLAGVWKECERVLVPDGLLVFTYHHSRSEGWRSVLASLLTAGFVVVRAHPVKAEMSVATPKHQAREPIDLDMIIVCRKRTASRSNSGREASSLVLEAAAEALDQLRRLRRAGRRASRSDIRVVLMAQTVCRLSHCSPPEAALDSFDRVLSAVEPTIDSLQQEVGPDATASCWTADTASKDDAD